MSFFSSFILTWCSNENQICHFFGNWFGNMKRAFTSKYFSTQKEIYVAQFWTNTFNIYVQIFFFSYSTTSMHKRKEIYNVASGKIMSIIPFKRHKKGNFRFTWSMEYFLLVVNLSHSFRKSPSFFLLFRSFFLLALFSFLRWFEVPSAQSPQPGRSYWNLLISWIDRRLNHTSQVRVSGSGDRWIDV